MRPTLSRLDLGSMVQHHPRLIRANSLAVWQPGALVASVPMRPWCQVYSRGTPPTLVRCLRLLFCRPFIHDSYHGNVFYCRQTPRHHVGLARHPLSSFGGNDPLPRMSQAHPSRSHPSSTTRARLAVGALAGAWHPATSSRPPRRVSPHVSLHLPRIQTISP